MKWIAGVFLAILTAGPSLAVPQINTISSETLSTAPLRVRTTFTIQLIGYEPFAYWGIDVEPGTGTAVQFFDCEAPVSWLCYPPAALNNANRVEFVDNNLPWPWPGIATFSIVTDQAIPCVDLVFWNGLLSKTPQVNDNYIVSGCLAVDAPTPTASSSWGRVKATYR